MAFDDDWDELAEVEYFDAAAAQGHLLIIRAFDAPKYYRTENNPDGMVHPGRGKNFEPFPNTVVRCAVADLDATQVDGTQGRIYPEAVLFPFSITKVAKSWIGKGPQLVMWRKDGNKQTDPYVLRNMRTDEQAVQVGKTFLHNHPEFMELNGPDAYDERPPQPREDRDSYGDRRDTRVTRRRDEGEWDRREVRRDDWDERPRYEQPSFRGERDSGRTRYNGDGGARDWGQHDDRPRRTTAVASYSEEDTWARQAPRQRDDRDGSFLSRSRNHHGDPQGDEDIPF